MPHPVRLGLIAAAGLLLYACSSTTGTAIGSDNSNSRSDSISSSGAQQSLSAMLSSPSSDEDSPSTGNEESISGADTDTASLDTDSGSAPSPTSASVSSAPEMQPAPDNLLATVDPSGLRVTKPVSIDASKATIVGPAGSLAITAVGEIDTVPQDAQVITGSLSDDVTYGPAAGHRLVMVTVTATDGWPPPDADIASAAEQSSSPDATVTLAAGGGRTDVTEQTAFGEGSGPVTFLVSVATGDKPSLILASKGHEQEIDILSAIRKADPLSAIYYVQNQSEAVNKAMPTWHGTFKDQDSETTSAVSYDLSVKTIVFTGYDPDKGWAASGTMWAAVGVADNADVENGSEDVNYSGWTLTVPGGKPIKASSNTLSRNDTGYAAFQVPATANSIKGNFPSAITATSFGGKPHMLQTSSLSFTAKLGR